MEIKNIFSEIEGLINEQNCLLLELHTKVSADTIRRLEIVNNQLAHEYNILRMSAPEELNND